MKSWDRAKQLRYWKTYGLTEDAWKSLFKTQGGVCWICETLPKNGILCVDHLHIPKFKNMPPEEKIKYVRGLLCFQCNTSFGRLERRKNPRKLLEGVTKYFANYPMKGDKI